MYMSFDIFVHIFVFLLDIHLEVKLLNHRRQVCSAWVDTDRGFAPVYSTGEGKMFHILSNIRAASVFKLHADERKCSLILILICTSLTNV